MWDEASMLFWKTLDTVDRTLKDLMKNDQLFGGKILIMGGDFRLIMGGDFRFCLEKFGFCGPHFVGFDEK
jgi:hypothetical protein